MRVGNESWEWEQMRTWNGMRFGNESWELGTEVEITCGHRSISVHLAKMTAH